MSADVSFSEIWLVEFGRLYRLYEETIGSGEGRLWKFEMLAGGRYNSLKGELDFPVSGDVHGTRDWVDPFVGMRLRQASTRDFYLV